MDSIFRGSLSTRKGQTLAWIDALFVDHALFRVAWSNFAVVSPGRLYRCNHPTPGRLIRMTHDFGVKTLINLRGRAGNGSDALSRAAAVRLGLEVIDLPLESRGAPQRDRILRLHQVYRSMEAPGLLHCKSGADRAGLAAGLCVLFDGGTAQDALRQLSLRFGHIKAAKTGILDAFFLHWKREGEGRKPFLDWVREDYDEAALRQSFRSRGFANLLADWVLAHE